MLRGDKTVPVVTVKTKFQVTIPQEVREVLGIAEGDLLEAKVENGKIVLTPKELIDRRAAAFRRMEALGERVRKRLAREGMTEEDLDRMIEKEVEAVRTRRYAGRG
ncbi:AbrB/MazE/SpoVT family DNA-binding domain-containing protein [uncultured Meiothermus sp.]|jgi:AbrB family looped-hinge helix DNA binding protein|uniref:AbrB/MazE/SpoVT family DNA-binding domain-containing protein n=1 Tax=uncultured Meiothermus sp. TaxID=157471 RepID=UPI0026157B8A|nr:AbrB/MazE/SpoVT family DNA-binding domain-containing protein [uncultured Meiothermus sp.]